MLAEDSLAGLYILAQTYELPTLKKLVIGNIKECVNLAKCPAAIFELARRIYDHIPAMDADFKSWFHKEVVKAVLSNSKGTNMALLEAIDESKRKEGSLARKAGLARISWMSILNTVGPRKADALRADLERSNDWGVTFQECNINLGTWSGNTFV